MLRHPCRARAGGNYSDPPPPSPHLSGHTWFGNHRLTTHKPVPEKEVKVQWEGRENSDCPKDPTGGRRSRKSQSDLGGAPG